MSRCGRPCIEGAEAEALRNRLRAFVAREHYGWNRIMVAAGFSDGQGGLLLKFVRGTAGITHRKAASLAAALDRFPVGWPPVHARGAKAQLQTLHIADSRAERERLAIIAAAERRAAERLEYELYWLAAESPGIDGHRHRCTPLSQQVA